MLKREVDVVPPIFFTFTAEGNTAFPSPVNRERAGDGGSFIIAIELHYE